VRLGWRGCAAGFSAALRSRQTFEGGNDDGGTVSSAGYGPSAPVRLAASPATGRGGPVRGQLLRGATAARSGACPLLCASAGVRPTAADDPQPVCDRRAGSPRRRSPRRASPSRWLRRKPSSPRIIREKSTPQGRSREHPRINRRAGAPGRPRQPLRERSPTRSCRRRSRVLRRSSPSRCRRS
jgi:hypothetical protein